MMFINEQINIEQLPTTAAVTLTPISKQFLKVILINKFLMVCVLLLVLFLAKQFVDKPLFQSNFWMVITLLSVVLVINVILAVLAFKKRKYALREHDLIYAHGLLMHSVVTVPMSRIQHIEVSRTWLARQWQLATLNIYTAGESGSDLSIKGLPKEEAQRINDYVSERINGIR